MIPKIACVTLSMTLLAGASPSIAQDAAAANPAQIQLNTGIFYVPGFAPVTAAQGLAATPAPDVTTVQVGWTSLPKQTKFESWTLSCRDARLVAYADVDHAGIDLKQEVLGIINNCANSAVQQISLGKVVSNPREALGNFVDKFGTCTKNSVAERAKAVGLHLETEHGDWGKC